MWFFNCHEISVLPARMPQQARRAPRDINNRFWHRLSTQPLSPALGPARHTADLVHAHLEALLGDLGGDLTLAIPGAMESGQLSLQIDGYS